MISRFLCQVLSVAFGALYPAYRTYKALKNRNLREQVKLEMYWITFACFSVGEPILDLILFWLPFYYEMKFVCILWTIPVSPLSQGGMFAYKKLIHPILIKNEFKIDQFIEKAKDHSFKTFSELCSFMMKYGSNLFVQILGDSQSVIKNYFNKTQMHISPTTMTPKKSLSNEILLTCKKQLNTMSIAKDANVEKEF